MSTWTDKETLGFGITCYRGVIKPELNIIERLENTLGSPAPWGELSEEGKQYHWLPAYVGYQQLMPEYRDCYDFKFKKTDIENDKGEDSLLLQRIWQDVYDAQAPVVVDSDKVELLGSFPFFIIDGWEGTIPAGTPFLQVLPFKRENWEHEIEILDSSSIYAKIVDNANIYRQPDGGVYKDKVWTRREYK